MSRYAASSGPWEHKPVRRRSKTIAALTWTTAALSFLGLSVALASKTLPNTATTSLTAQEQAQAHREGW